MSDDSIPVLKLDYKGVVDRHSPLPRETEEQDPLIWRLYKDQGAGVVQLLTDQREGLGTGTAFAVNDSGKFVTAFHCVKGGRALVLLDKNGNSHPARIEAIDDVLDLAVIQARDGKNCEFKPLTFGSSQQLDANEKVAALGHPRGRRELVASPGHFTGNVTGLKWKLDGMGLLPGIRHTISELAEEPAELRRDRWASQMSDVVAARVHGAKGSSGGPLFDLRGNVVGVAKWAIQPDAVNMAFAPSERVQDLISGKNSKFAIDHHYRQFSHGELVEMRALGAVMATGVGYGMLRAPLSTSKVGALAAVPALVRDYRRYTDSFDDRSRLKYGLAATADATVLGSCALSLGANLLGANKLRRVGQALAYTGFLGRLGTSFISDDYDGPGTIRRLDSRDTRPPL